MIDFGSTSAEIDATLQCTTFILAVCGPYRAATFVFNYKILLKKKIFKLTQVFFFNYLVQIPRNIFIKYYFDHIDSIPV